jgi:OFA family oxalate/formate antiporter-like MFS transporter
VPEAAPKSKIYYGYVIVVACYFIMMVYWGTTFSYGIFFDSLLKDFGWTRAATSGAYSLMTLVFGFSGMVIAKLSDKYGPRIVIGACGTLMGIGYIFLSRITEIWHLYLGYDIFIAIGMGSYISLLPMVARWFTKRRALMTAALSSGMGLGSILFPPIVEKLISIYQWRTSFLIFAAIVIVTLLIATQFLKWDPRRLGLKPYGESETGNATLKLTGLALPQAVRTRQFWLLGAMYFSYVFCQTTVLVHIFLHALGMNVSPANAAGIVSIFGVLQIIGMYVNGYIADKFRNRAAFLICFVLLTLSFIWLIFVARDVLTFYIFGAILGFAGGGMQILFSPMTAEIFGLKSHGTILGSLSFLASFGSAMGGFLAGYIFDINKSYTLAFIICGSLAFLAIIYTLLVRPITGPKAVFQP